MKNIFKISFLFCLLLMAYVAEGQEVLPYKTTIWVHGLGGSPASWAKASDATYMGDTSNPLNLFSKRKITTPIYPTYQQISLSHAGNELRRSIDAHSMTTSPENTYIISHSLGGLVSRAVDQQLYEGYDTTNPRKFKGIVTFGSAHGGASIIDGKEKIKQTFQDGCVLSEGPLREIVENEWIAGLLIGDKTYNSITEAVCEQIVGFGINFFAKDFDQPITQDFSVATANNPTSLLYRMNQTNTGTPIVQFHGVESDPLIWKTFNYAVPGYKQPNIVTPFQANSDEGLPEDMNKLFLHFQAKYDSWRITADYIKSFSNGVVPCDWYDWAFPITAAVCLTYDAKYWEAVKKRDAYKRGVDYLTSINTKYKTAIGARVTVTNYSYKCCTGISAGSSCFFSTKDPGDCYRNGLQPQMVAVTTTVEKPSDGIVLQESATKILPNTLRDPNGKPIIPIPMLGSNHFQMVNDRNTKESLSKLYDGGFGRTFQLEKIN